MIISPYRTSVTAAHQDSGKRAAPSDYNGKPYRNRRLKKEAAANAEKHKDGVYRTNTQVLHHKKPNQR